MSAKLSKTIFVIGISLHAIWLPICSYIFLLQRGSVFAWYSSLSNWGKSLPVEVAAAFEAIQHPLYSIHSNDTTATWHYSLNPMQQTLLLALIN